MVVDGRMVSAEMELTEGLGSCPFPYQLSRRNEGGIVRGIADTVESDGDSVTSSFGLVGLSSLARTRNISLIRERLMDPRFVDRARNETLLLDGSRDVDVVVGRRSRVELRIVASNLSLRRTCSATSGLSALLSRGLRFTFSSGLNCLARYPAGLNANVETSIVLRLPTLRGDHAVNEVTNGLSGLKLAVHNTCNRNSRPDNSLCRLSGRMALNVSRGTTVRGLRGVAGRLISRRRRTERELTGDVSVRSDMDEDLNLLGSTVIVARSRTLGLLSGIHFNVLSKRVGSIATRIISSLVRGVRPTALVMGTKGGLSTRRESVRETGVLERTLS